MNRPHFIAVIAFSSLIPSVVLALHDTYSFLNFSPCGYHTLENDPLTDNKTYEQWVRSAKQLSTTPDAPWGVFHMKDGARIGICRLMHEGTPKSEFVCRSESFGNFPLAGATYKPIVDKGTLSSFRCASGRGLGVPVLIHDEGYESEGETNIELKNAQKKFERICRKG